MKIETQSVSSHSLTSRLAAFVAIAVVSALGAGNAWAKDSLSASVTNATGAPVVVNNGQAVGTIQPFYTVNADAFPIGQFATFDLNWVTSAGPGPATNYGSGVTLTLGQDQQGGYVDLAPSTGTFTLTATAQNGTSQVTISITADKNGNLPPTADGTDLVANLKLNAGSDVRTETSVQVHIRLVHPTDCLKVYNFVTDQDFNLGILSTTSLKIGTSGQKAGKVISSQPGQFSDNVLIANTCVADHSFDLTIGLDGSFDTNPNGNPGNAVFGYTAAGEFDTSSFNAMMTGGTGYGQNVCLQNVTVPAGTSFLATVHSGVRKDLLQTSLPTDGTFDFAATLHENVNTGCAGALYSQASPNPVAFTLPFTKN